MLPLCHRSALRKIFEHDDTPAKTMVLCVSKVFAHEDQRSKEPCGEEEEKTGRLVSLLYKCILFQPVVPLIS